MAGSCMRCGRCCTRFAVCVTPFDVRRIAEATGMKPEEFIDTVPEPEKRERNEPGILLDGARALLVLKRDGSDVCFFYNGSGCAAYENRPMLCKTYPFRKSSDCKLQSMKSRACPESWLPGCRDGSQYICDCTSYESEIAKYKIIADEWNAKGGGSLRSFLSFVLSPSALQSP